MAGLKRRSFLFIDEIHIIGIMILRGVYIFNRQKTFEVFHYDIDPDSSRKSSSEQQIAPGIKRNDMSVIDNCPECKTERMIKYRQSVKNKLCSKCFHNTPDMLEAKQNQNKEKSEETKQKMRDNHWSKTGGVSAFKGKKHTEEVKQILSDKGKKQHLALSEEQMKHHRVISSLQKGRTLEDFTGFSTPEGTRIRQSPEGKAWSYDVLSKSNFTCEKCGEKGGALHAHHKNAFNAYPEQRFDIENGACLCESCHSNFHSIYGKGHNTKQQYNEFKD